MNTTIKLCSIDNCKNKRHARGFCQNHYHRLRKHGDPLKGGTPRGALLEFLAEIIKTPEPNDCIEWPYGTIGSDGYGSVVMDGQMMTAHRAALILFTGVNHKHLCAAHGECHNRLCVNPLHLSWKTAKENAADRKRDGTAQIGERHVLAKLTEGEVLAILQDRRSQREIAADYGVHQSLISLIKTGKRWAHLAANVS